MHLYLHIPFCKQACHYCDFHFSTSQKNKTDLVQAMMRELEMRKQELPAGELTTIYFGGGTPSILSAEELHFIFENISKHFSIAENAEITLEANPDDLSREYLRMLKQTPVNRLSIGIQSFRDEDLQLMNRAHSSKEAEAAVRDAQDAGFSNLTVDLIYGIPGLSENAWLENLSKIRELNIPHLSSYCLTVESRTALAHFVKQGKIKPVDEEQSSSQFLSLVRFATENGFSHYEISNFAKEGFVAKHNSSYWFGEPYLGLGPSAHSYDGKIRRWNISNNAQYVKRISENQFAYESEELTAKDRFNEYLMTRLRTIWGISENEIREQFGNEHAVAVMAAMEEHISRGEAARNGDRIFLTEKGRLLADRIASDLFWV